MTPYQNNRLTDLIISKLLYGARPAVRAADFVHDKRSIHRVWRELKTGEYVTETGTLVGEATTKAFDAIPEVPINLSEHWDKVSKSMAPHIRGLGIIVFSNLSPSDKKYVAMHRDQYTWFSATTRLFFSETYITPANLSVGVDGSLDDQFAVKFRNALSDMETLEQAQYGSGYHSHLIFIQDAALREHVTAVRKAEMFDEFYRRQFQWAVTLLGIADIDDVSVFRVEEADLFTSDYLFACIGNDPAKWESRVNEGIEKAKTDVIDINNALDRMKRVRDGIINAGGWEAFHARYKERLNQALEERMAQFPKLAGGD